MKEFNTFQFKLKLSTTPKETTTFQPKLNSELNTLESNKEESSKDLPSKHPMFKSKVEKLKELLTKPTLAKADHELEVAPMFQEEVE